MKKFEINKISTAQMISIKGGDWIDEPVVIIPHYPDHNEIVSEYITLSYFR